MELIGQLQEQSSTIEQAAEYVNDVILSSKRAKLPSPDVNNFLQQTVQTSPYTLYRGVGLFRDRIPEQVREQARSLSPGDQIPEFLQGDSSTLVYCTKKKTIAREYAEGTIELVLQIVANPNQIIVDLANLHKIIPPDSGLIDEEDYNYFRQDKEVLVRGPVNGTIIHAKRSGRL